MRCDTEARRIVRTTNGIESVNARIRRVVKARGHFHHLRRTPVGGPSASRPQRPER
ncbi:transposase [Streptomyces sp. PRh5]|uniref:transposase n=1 Tax=Streptomyces sp. PRh5 TaxID=1158056 RepID=UPI00241050D7|nr:transposase [Streptomyces sp. PRh5]